MRLALALLLLPTIATAEPPRAVTQAWLRSVDRDRWPIGSMIDLKRGLIVIRYMVDSGSDDAVPELSARRLCGADLDRALPDLRVELAAIYKSADMIACQNKPFATCSFHMADEYYTVANVSFDKQDDGTLGLTSVVFTSRIPNDRMYEEYGRWMAAKINKLAATSCDAAPK